MSEGETRAHGIRIEQSVALPVASREAIHGFARTMRASCEQFLGDEGFVPPAGLIFGSRAPANKQQILGGVGVLTYLVTVDFDFYGGFSEKAKDDFSWVMRKLCWDTDAVAAFYVSESWQVTNAESVKEIEGYIGRLEEHPNAEECVHARLETRDEVVTYVARIYTYDDGKKGLSPWSQEVIQRGKGVTFQGRFANFIVRHRVPEPPPLVPVLGPEASSLNATLQALFGALG